MKCISKHSEARSFSFRFSKGEGHVLLNKQACARIQGQSQDLSPISPLFVFRFVFDLTLVRSKIILCQPKTSFMTIISVKSRRFQEI